MALPKLLTPKFTVKLPSTGKEVTFRPFLVAEEKALLMAAEAGDQESQLAAIKNSIIACVDDVDVKKLPFFDVEFLFLNLRMKSAGEQAKFTYRHRDGINRAGDACDHATEVVVDLEKVQVSKNPDHVSKFMIDEKYGVKMKYPTIDDVEEMIKQGNDENVLLAKCIDVVYDDTETYTPDSLEEAIGFVKQMNGKQYAKLEKWFDTMPSLTHSVTYRCAGCEQEDTVVFQGVADFFA